MFFLISNTSVNDMTVTVYVSRGAGDIWITPWYFDGQSFLGYSGFNFTLRGSETRKFRLTGSSSVQIGYLEITGMRGMATDATDDLSISYFYNYSENEKLKAVSGSWSATHSKAFYFPVETSSTVRTGIAFAPSRYPSINLLSGLPVTITLHRGSESQGKTVTFLCHNALFIDEIFPELLGTTFTGYVSVTSTNFIYVEVLRMDTTPDGFMLTNTPPTAPYWSTF